MHTKTIANTVTNAVELGAGAYGSRLTIATQGAVKPAATSATAIYAPAGLANARLVNDGIVFGAAGSKDYGAQGGGAGVDFAVSGVVVNQGTIGGGSGEGFTSGGVGIDLAAGGTVANHGFVTGGMGGATGYYGEAGGGAVMIGALGTVTNTGTIKGGAGGSAEGAGQGGTGVDFAAAGSLVNRGLILGGNAGYGAASAGGYGVLFAGVGALTNFGTIAAGDSFAAGVDFMQGGTLLNVGTIIGGPGETAGYYGGEKAGAGVIMSGIGTIANQGTILGGKGGSSIYAAGLGGAGVKLSGGTLFNSGSIGGGAGGGYPGYKGADGGAGVYLNGGTLITTGTISGGLPGGKLHSASQGDAVQFGSAAGTLILYPSAVFSGDILANKAAADTLVLAGSGHGTLSGLGTTVKGFTTIDEAEKAHWLLNGTITGTGSINIGNEAALVLNGQVSIATIAFGAGTGESVALDTPAAITSIFSGFSTGDTIGLPTLKAASLSYDAGTLTLFDASHDVLGILLFSGSYTQQNFMLDMAGHGTDVLYEATDRAMQGGPLGGSAVFSHGLLSYGDAAPVRFGDAHALVWGA